MRIDECGGRPAPQNPWRCCSWSQSSSIMVSRKRSARVTHHLLEKGKTPIRKRRPHLICWRRERERENEKEKERESKKRQIQLIHSFPLLSSLAMLRILSPSPRRLSLFTISHRSLSTLVLKENPAAHHDFSGFLNRANARIAKHRKSPYIRGQPDLMTDLMTPGDLKWIEALRLSVSSFISLFQSHENSPKNFFFLFFRVHVLWLGQECHLATESGPELARQTGNPDAGVQRPFSSAGDHGSAGGERESPHLFVHS